LGRKTLLLIAGMIIIEVIRGNYMVLNWGSSLFALLVLMVLVVFIFSFILYSFIQH
jgi:hypothetical protein